MSADPHTGTEVRIALVLYGGVSLAVYENGVARAFHDLVRRRGVFGPLLSLLDARAIVDVISGASAGGINGLMLATALESGAEFRETAVLWRRLADLGVLLGSGADADAADSLLDGGYFHDALVGAFRKLSAGVPGAECDFEMDVFVAATDIDGHAREYRDGLGEAIRDKEHRLIFHLQHRPGRKSLGVRKRKAEVAPETQAQVLGAIARVTASFPVAFSPVRLDRMAPELRQALVDATHGRLRVGPGGPSLVDGGVLDNKPFGPALRAIFHRMPDGRRVDRRLFYVEPDPVPFLDEAREHSSIGIGLASLTSIPAHEGIADDLDRLLEHNRRVDWLGGLRQRVGARIDTARPAAPTEAYLGARIRAFAQLWVLDTYSAPSASHYPLDDRHEAVLEALESLLAEELAPSGADSVGTDLTSLDAIDVVFHLRRAFHLLYAFHEQSEERESPNSDPALVPIGRVIRTLRMILDLVPVRREVWLADLAGIEPAAASRGILENVRRFFLEEGDRWAPLREDLDGRETAFLSPGTLSALVDRLREVGESPPAGPATESTILDRLGGALRSFVCQNDGDTNPFDQFNAIDIEVYPLEFACGLYELDRIDFARISPADAQLGLSRGDPRAKVSGDQLAHFSAFFCRDWRTNDILEGRFDGACQIVRALLTREALGRALRRGVTIDAKTLEQAVPRCPAAQRTALLARWEEVCDRWPSLAEHEQESATLDLQASLVLVGQLDAFYEDAETFFADLRYQEIRFGRSVGPGGATGSTIEGLIEQEARRQARLDLAGLSPEDTLGAFRDLGTGRQPVSGAKGRVPPRVLGEYATLAYLKTWNMLGLALGERSGLLGKARVRLLFRTPVAFLHQTLVLMRRDRKAASLLTATVAGAGLGALVLAAMVDLWWLAAGLLVALTGVLALSNWLFRWLARGDRRGPLPAEDADG